MHGRQKQVKQQFFPTLLLEKKPQFPSRIWSKSTRTLSLHAAPRCACPFQFTAVPVLPTDQAEDFPSTDPSHPTPTPCCRLYLFGFGFVFRSANPSSAPVVFQHVLRTSCTEWKVHIHTRHTYHERPYFEVTCEWVSP